MWNQPGFALVSDVVLSGGSLPMVHHFAMTEHDAKSEEGRIIALLPEDLRVNLRVVPATLNF